MNPRVDAIPPSAIRRVAAKKRPTSIDLGLGEPTLLPTVAHFEAAMRDVARSGVKYTPNAGDPPLRAAIAEHYAYPAMAAAENVCVTTGSQEAMYVALMTLLDPATDELLVVEPAFPSYVKMAALLGIACRTVEMDEGDGFAFDAQRIVAAIGPSTRAIVICSPCNPTGRAIRSEQAVVLAEHLASRAGSPVWLLADEIYREQRFVEDVADLARLYPQTIVTNSLSKSNALTGLRLGWLLGPQPFVERAIKAHAWVTSCADTFAQRVALSIFRTPGALREHAGWYAAARDRLLQTLAGSGLAYVAPDGAFYACVRLPEGGDSFRAADELIEAHDVLAIPGAAFGRSLEGWLRLSWVAPPPVVAEGIRRIANYAGAATALR